MTTTTPYALGPNDAREEFAYGGAMLRYLARAADTDGRATLFEARGTEPFPGPPLHVHHDGDEAFLLLAGSAVVQLGDERHELVAGGFVWMPHGVPHTFAVRAGGFHAVALSMPGGIEKMFAEQQAYFDGLGGAAPDPARLAAIAAPFGRLVGPPLQLD